MQKKISIPLMLVAVSILIMGASGTAYAQGSAISLTATAQDGSDTIKVTGKTTLNGNDITIQVEDPKKNIRVVGQITPDSDGNFEIDIKINTETWSKDGLYTIVAQYGNSETSKISVRVQVMNGQTFETMVTESTFPKAIVPNNDIVTLRGLEITADAMEGTQLITIHGETDRMQTPITLKVISPNGNIISVEQISPTSDGTFSTEIMVGGMLWSQDGDYMISAQQGAGSGYQDTVTVEILDGKVIPEFGTIAALILAVAIVSIIAVSARSRLSIMPKY